MGEPVNLAEAVRRAMREARDADGTEGADVVSCVVEETSRERSAEVGSVSGDGEGPSGAKDEAGDGGVRAARPGDAARAALREALAARRGAAGREGAG
ncbi:MAG TPA: hypothetical protein VIU15_11220, partial [Streptomyces sp.]